MKKLIVFALCIMLVLSVVGCGAKTNFVVNNRIVIENLDTQYGGYWGDSEWNYDLK